MEYSKFIWLEPKQSFSQFASFVTYHQGLVLEYISHFLIPNRLLGSKCGLWTLLRYAYISASKNDPGRSTRQRVTDSLNSEAKPLFQDMVWEGWRLTVVESFESLDRAPPLLVSHSVLV